MHSAVIYNVLCDICWRHQKFSISAKSRKFLRKHFYQNYVRKICTGAYDNFSETFYAILRYYFYAKKLKIFNNKNSTKKLRKQLSVRFHPFESLFWANNTSRIQISHQNSKILESSSRINKNIHQKQRKNKIKDTTWNFQVKKTSKQRKKQVSNDNEKDKNHTTSTNNIIFSLS